MVRVTHLCTSCVQTITNPICPYCFSKHIVIWMRDKQLQGYKINRIKKLLRNLVVEAEETPSDIRCIICGSKRVNLCIYCFISKVMRILENNLKEKRLIKDFDEDFDTKLWTMR